MAKHITRWTPDTHDCVIEYEWDDAVPAEERVHTFKRFVKEPGHQRFQALATKKERFDKVVEENQRKNYALGHILDNLPDTEVKKEIGESYPTYGTAQKATWVATYGSSDANQAWGEFGVLNAASSGKLLNRKVSAQGNENIRANLGC